jgi:hypothetical protein
MADHDHSYKLLFAHPQMVRDLLEGFVGGGWLREVDFSTLERVSDSYVSDDLRARADDIVWRVRCGERYVYLLVEFQSSVEPFMAVRVLTYVGLLYQNLIRGREILDGSLPAVLPIVLYNGARRWRAPADVSSLLNEPCHGLESYRPSLRYLLIDESAYDDADLAGRDNLVAVLFQLESCVRYDRLRDLVSRLTDLLDCVGQASLRRAFAVWMDKVLLARLSGERMNAINELWEKQSMLSERVIVWEQELMQKAEANLLTRLLRKRFGEMPDSVRARLSEATPDELVCWSERLLEVESLNEVFGAEPIIGGGQPS